MQQYSVSPTLWLQRPDTKGYCRLKIRVTVNRKSSYVKTSHKLKPAQWDEKKKKAVGIPNADKVNALIRKTVSEVEGTVLTRLLEGGEITPRFLRGGSSKEFAAYAKEVRNDKKELARLQKFAGAGLMLSDVTSDFLRKYETHRRALGNAQNTLNTTFRFMRRIMRQAYAEKLILENPFDHYKVPKPEETSPVFLEEPEKQKLIKLLDKPIDAALYNTLCYFLLACYTGFRHSDWSKFDPEKMVVRDVVRLRAKKNKTWVMLPIGKTLSDVIARIKGIGRPVSLDKCNGHLKVLQLMAELEKEITTHSGRHSFGAMCAYKQIPRIVAAELMGITEKQVAVYYHLTGMNIRDQAAVLKEV